MAAGLPGADSAVWRQSRRNCGDTYLVYHTFRDLSLRLSWDLNFLTPQSSQPCRSCFAARGSLLRTIGVRSHESSRLP